VFVRKSGTGLVCVLVCRVCCVCVCVCVLRLCEELCVCVSVGVCCVCVVWVPNTILVRALRRDRQSLRLPFEDT